MDMVDPPSRGKTHSTHTWVMKRGAKNTHLKSPLGAIMKTLNRGVIMHGVSLYDYVPRTSVCAISWYHSHPTRYS